MKIRAEFHLGSLSSKLVLVPRPEEKLDHLALKLAAYAMMLPLEPIVDPSVNHPALRDFDLKPDLLALNMAGEIVLWLECGEVSINKLDKVIRRLPDCRVVVLKPNKHKALQQREMVAEHIRQADRVEIWAWPDDTFKEWEGAVEEKIEIFGEAHEKSLNLVINQTAVAVDLESY